MKELMRYAWQAVMKVFLCQYGANRPIEPELHRLLLTFVLAFSINLMTSLSKEPKLWASAALLIISTVILVIYGRRHSNIDRTFRNDKEIKQLSGAAEINALEDSHYDPAMPMFRFLLRFCLLLLIVSFTIYTKVIWKNPDTVSSISKSTTEIAGQLDLIGKDVKHVAVEIEKCEGFLLHDRDSINALQGPQKNAMSAVTHVGIKSKSNSALSASGFGPVGKTVVDSKQSGIEW